MRDLGAEGDKINMATYTITKKIAKHGRQTVIIIPTLLQEQLKSGTLVEVRIEVIE